MISRAKTLDRNLITGHLCRVFSGDKIVLVEQQSYIQEDEWKHFNFDAIQTEDELGRLKWYEIDPSTLEYKIGNEWFSMEDLERITKNLDVEYIQKNKLIG